jgi:DNA-binding transcriptional LysR family regulator
MTQPRAADTAYANALSLDQLRVLLAIVETGSFSAAARRLRRTQGAVSYHVAALESQLGVPVFDRSGRLPALTPAGSAVVAHARQVLASLDALRSVAWGMSTGLEARLSLAVNILHPQPQLARHLEAFAQAFPSVHVLLHTGILHAAGRAVREGHSQLGILSYVDLGPDLVVAPCDTVTLVPVVAPSHPLGQVAEPVDDETLQSHLHLVLVDDEPDRPDVVGFPSTRRWRVNDAALRLELLRAGIGWARMPRHMVEADLATGVLVPVRARRWQDRQTEVDLYVACVRGATLGPAGQWLWDRLSGR